MRTMQCVSVKAYKCESKQAYMHVQLNVGDNEFLSPTFPMAAA